MKWIIALAALLLLVSPAFAANVVLNPSFELTQNDSSNGRNNPDNLTLPLDWFLYDYNPNGADQVAWSPSLAFVNTTAGYAGSNSLEIVNDADAVAVTQTIPNITDGFYLEFYVNILSGNTTSWNFEIGASFPDDKEIHINTTGGITECIGSNFTCNTISVGGGWYKINATLTTALTGTALSTTTGLPFIFLGTDGVGSIGDSILLDNVILNPTASPTPITPAPITGATANIIGFLPLLIGVGIIVMVARKIEDMEGTNDLIAIIVGSGIAIVFLGVLSAVIFGVI